MKKTFLILSLLLVFIGVYAQESFVVSSYIRGNFYNQNRIRPVSMNACTDLICLGVEPDQNGSLVYEKFRMSDRDAGGLTDLIQKVRQQISDSVSLRIGISGGDNWKVMITRASSRKKFVTQVKQLLDRTAAKGVDLDFEWAQTEQEYTDYSLLITELRREIGPDLLLTVSLHPISYRIHSDAIDAINYASLQCYGPSPVRFSYAQYIKDVNKVLTYGIPPHKLVPGIPFYGVTADGSRQSTAYFNFVEADLINNPMINKVIYNGQSYIFNGQDEVKQKTTYARYKNLRGVMFWDLATDVSYDNRWSLLRAMKEALD
ncbi:MAG: glycoside hydrolase family 18 protein [Bacteroidales bacterium]